MLDAHTEHREADVILDVDVDRGLLFLLLENLGDLPAHPVRVRFERPLHGLGGKRWIDRILRRGFHRRPDALPLVRGVAEGELDRRNVAVIPARSGRPTGRALARAQPPPHEVRRFGLQRPRPSGRARSAKAC